MRGFRVKIENPQKIFNMLKGTLPVTVLGKASLSTPLENVQVFAESSGTAYSMSAYISIDSFKIKESDKTRYVYPVQLPFSLLEEKFTVYSPRGDIIYVYPFSKAQEPLFIIVRKRDGTGRIIVSAGEFGEESAPALSLKNYSTFVADLRFLSYLIKTLIKGIYSDYSKHSTFKEPETILYIRAPLNLSFNKNNFFEFNHQDKFEEDKADRVINKIDPEDIEESLEDVQGIDEAKEEVLEVIKILKNPERFESKGIVIPRGILLVGPPGTGKTMLAKALAKEMGLPFFSASGSSFVEVYVGRGAGRIRKLFNEARKNSPCIIFIDELDALARTRSGGYGGSSEYDHALSQFLVELDGIKRNKGIIIIAATNAPELLDSAVTRPGRFDRQIVLDLPSCEGRVAILKVHSKNKPISKEVDFMKIALSTPGFSGADLANIINEAAVLALVRENSKFITEHHIREAIYRVKVGFPRKIRLEKEEKMKAAYHEIGHAIIHTVLYPDADPVDFVTIKPRGNALGVCVSFPEKDRKNRTRKRLEAELTIFMGGAIAEELIFGKDNQSDGARSDIQNATILAKKMVREWGMSKLGFVHFGNLRLRFLDKTIKEAEVSEKYKAKIDKLVIKKLAKARKRARKILKKHKKELKILAELLFLKETLEGKEIRKVLNK